MQQFYAMAFLTPNRAYPFLAMVCLCLAGCGKEEISTFSVPKETSRLASASSPIPSAAPIQWTTPTGWEELPAGGMRIGSFAVSNDTQRADISIIPLGGVSGSELDNVNRWRGQVGLAPVDAANLTVLAEKVSIGTAPASLYDLAGTDPQSKQPARILAAILSAEGTTWFFKMVGPSTLVEQEKPAFKKLLESVRFQAASPEQALPDGHPPVSMGSSDLSTIAGHEGASASEKPAWEVPAGWEEQAPTSMRVATFIVTGTSGAKADVSVIKLSGTAGGLLGNVNRWRSQVGLQPVDEAGLAKLVTTQDVSGVKITVADMAGRNVESGDPARLVAATVPQGGSTWFYKMLGTEQVVEEQKTAFIKFVETARYPNAL